MKTTIIAMLAMAAISAQAALVDVTGAKQNSGGVASSGTSSIVSAFSDNVAASGQIVYSISGLSLDGIGVSNDTVTVTVSVTGFDASTNNVQILRANKGRISYGDDKLRITDVGDQINFTSIAVTDVSLNGSTDAAWTADSTAAYTGINLGGVSSTYTRADVNGVEYANIATNPVSFYCDIPDATYINTELLEGKYRVDVFDFQVNAIPEPNTIGMLSMSAVGLIALRRRLKA